MGQTCSCNCKLNDVFQFSEVKIEGMNNAANLSIYEGFYL